MLYLFLRRPFFATVLVLALAPVCGQLHAQGGAAFAVTAAGDTVVLPKGAWIAVDRHPQLLVFKDASGTKRYEPASRYAVVRVPSAAASQYARKDGPDLVARAIPTDTGADCWHFLQELYRTGDAVFYRSVHCRQCQRLRLYVQRGGGAVELVGKENWRGLCRAYLMQHPTARRDAAYGRYDAVRAERTLWELRR